MSKLKANEKNNSQNKRRAGSIDQSIKVSDNNQLKYIQKLKNVEPVEQVPLHDLYMRINGRWEFKGQSCGFCGTNMNLPRVIEYHRYVCKVLNKKDEDNADTPN